MRIDKRWLSLAVIFVVLVALLALAMMLPATAAARMDEAAAQGMSAVKADATPRLHGLSQTGLYIVRLKDPALASYTGGVSGLAATSPQETGARRFDPHAAASLAYADYLRGVHAAFVVAMENTLARPVKVVFDYIGTLNGMAVAVSHEEAAELSRLPGVAAVYADVERELETDVGPIHIGAPAVWTGDTASGVATHGEGIIVGMIDSGINSQHPSFAAMDGNGYTHTNPYGSGVFHGWCATQTGFCNDKLIGAYGLNPNGGNPEDTNGHGSHTASTAAGNEHDAVIVVGNDTYTRTLHGVAPRANIVAYKVCNPGCPGSASIAAVNHAIMDDDVDVLNYSISGTDDPWNDPVDLAFLDAFNAGIFVSASAGNDGPSASTVAKTGPWNAAVAASTINRVIANTFDITSPAPPPSLEGLAAVPGEGSVITSDIVAEIRYDGSNPTGCTGFSAGFFSGSLALIQRGDCTFATKVSNAASAGAVGVVVFNNVGGPPISMGGLTGTPPAVFIDKTDGEAVRDYIVANAPVSARINATTSLIIKDAWEDFVAGFSSRGPSQFELLKPDYIAPGVNILAAVAAQGGDPVQYGFYQGTSMSSPHGAGAAALMMALHPTWSPAAVKSAMATGAVGGLVKEDGLTPADPFDVGSGLLALDRASTVGLVFDETGADYLAANPASGGDPKTLNQPSVVNYACAGTCTWTRTVDSVAATALSYTTTVDGPPGMNITVTPASFDIGVGSSQPISIEVDATGMTAGEWAFGSVTLATNGTHPGSGLPVADTVIPVVVQVAAAPASISVTPASVAGTQNPGISVTHPLTITNNGGQELTWAIFGAGTAEGWADNFDSYATGSQLHGQGGWKGWFNDAAAGALAVDAERRSVPNAAEIVGASDLVHEFSGYDTGVWTMTAWQFIPNGFADTSYFILLNSYDDAGSNLNWSTQVSFDGSTNSVVNEGSSGGTLALVRDQWVELRVEINLYTDEQSFYYNDQLLYAGTWTDEVSGSGTLQLVAVDLFANNASAVYYDDLSVMQQVPGTCDAVGDVPWLSVSPTSGATAPGASSTLDVTFDATGLATGVYTGTLCVASNAPASPLVEVPLQMTVESATSYVIALPLVRLDGAP